MVGRLPDQFNDVVAAVTKFSDPAITGMSAGREWLPQTGEWVANLVGTVALDAKPRVRSD
jgi:hypothetical protein